MFVFESDSMKIKRILKFYFYAENIDLHFGRLIERYACDPNADCGETLERINILIDEKQRLNRLWSYIDMVAGGLKADEAKALKRYSEMRTSIKKLDKETERSIRRAGVKFVRHARRLESFGVEMRLVNKYYALL